MCFASVANIFVFSLTYWKILKLSFVTTSIIIVLFCINEQTCLPLIQKFQYQFPKERVCPCKPRPREFLGIVLVERLMHHVCVGITIDEHTHAFGYFLVAVACECTHHDAHWSFIIAADVWTSNAFCCYPLDEIWIALTKYKSARVKINGILLRHFCNVWKRKKAWHIGIVHEQLVSEAIHFVSVARAVAWIQVNGMFLQSCFYFVGQSMAFVS